MKATKGAPEIMKIRRKPFIAARHDGYWKMKP